MFAQWLTFNIEIVGQLIDETETDTESEQMMESMQVWTKSSLSLQVAAGILSTASTEDHLKAGFIHKASAASVLQQVDICHVVQYKYTFAAHSDADRCFLVVASSSSVFSLTCSLVYLDH